MVIATLSNMVFKLSLVLVVGGRALARMCLPAALAVMLGMVGMLMLNFWMV
jgi:hypothetical protein